MSSQSKATTIYALTDPRSGAVRYISKTTVRLSTRLYHHIHVARSGDHVHRSCWIRSLHEEGLKPLIEQVEIVPVGSDWAAREKYWIARMRQVSGALLTNISEGGDGVVGVTRNSQWLERISASLKGKKRGPMSDEHREAISAGNLGKKCPKSPEHREKLRQALLGRKNGPPSPGVRAKISAAQKGISKPAPTGERFDAWVATLQRGEHHHQAKLTTQDVLAIRADTRSNPKIAAEYGVTKTVVWSIKNRKTWVHI